MTEWAMPSERLAEYEHLRHRWQDEGRWQEVSPFVRGGFWRNFKVKYPETNEMYSRMQMVSRRLQEALDSGLVGPQIDQARIELYRGQCNCGYWHGAFGGAYLPHLRNAVFRHLIEAENLIDAAERRGLGESDQTWVELTSSDYNFDGRPEVRLASNRLVALAAPANGGQLYELDVRSIGHNLLATFTRRDEAYHYKIRGGEQGANGDVASIHDRVVFKQEGLDQRLQYDFYRRKGLVDHFFPLDASLDAVASGSVPEWGDFVNGAYEARLRRNPGRMQLQMIREGRVGERSIRITKGITLEAGEQTLEIAYLIENLPPGETFLFGVEWNFAGMPAGLDDRYFRDARGMSLGQLGGKLDLHDVDSLALVDQWLCLDVSLRMDRPTHIWTFPIETVSQSEAGFELVHQSVAVLPHWYVTAGSDGRWAVTMNLAIDTTAAERQPTIAEVIATA
jgi:alpha-amylase